MSYVISFVDGEEALSAAAPTVEEAMETARTLMVQGKQTVTVTNSVTGEVVGVEQVEQDAAKRDPT